MGRGLYRLGVNSFTIRTIKLPERLVRLNKQGYVNLSPSHAPTVQGHRKTATRGCVCVCVFLKLCFSVCELDVSFSSPKSRCLCKLSQERHRGYSVVRSLPPVKIKYETFIIQGGLI